MNHHGNQERTLRRSTRRSRGAITSSEVSEGNNDITKEVQPIQQQLEDQSFFQDYECAICLEVLSDPYIIPECCHRFCCDCIHDSIKAGNKECPTCRVHIVSKRNLRRDELFGKLLHRLLKVESEVKAMKSKEKTSTSLPLEIHGEESPANEFDEHVTNEQEDNITELSDCMKESKYQKKRKRISNENSSKRKKKAYSRNIFEQHLIDLRKFKEKYGHCNVPNQYKDDPSLGIWVSNMRHAYKQTQLGKKPKQALTQTNIEQLEKMGFQWKCSKNLSFEMQITKLQNFKEKHGHCDVPFRYEDDPSLGRWVSGIRQAYKQMKLGKETHTNLSEIMIEKLDELGFQWEIRNKSFERNFAKLQHFKEKHGHCNVPRKYTDNPSLGAWVNSMRVAYKKKKLGNKPKQSLTQARIDQLDEIGFQWQYRKFKV